MTLSKIGFAAAFVAAVAGFAPSNDHSPISSAYAQSLPTLANLTECVSKEEFGQRLNNEGQYMLLKGDRHAALAGEVVALKNIFTADANFQYGYQILTTPVGKYCKVDTYDEPRLLEARKNGIDGRTEMPSNLKDVKGSLTNALMLSVGRGEYPMLQYTSKFSNTGNTARVTIAGNIGGNGIILYADTSGMVKDNLPLNNVSYMNAANQTLAVNSKGLSLASVNP